MERPAQTGAALALEVAAVRSEARDVLCLELRAPGGGSLPPFAPGAHLELQLPNGLVRHYSLCNSAAESDRYVVGVGLSPNSRGGSRFVHDALRRGDVIRSSAPRNHFPLVQDAAAYRFVAGGIGVTPLLSMIHWCIDHGKPWRLHYCVRSRQRAAFFEVLRELDPGGSALHLHADDEQGGRFFDPAEALSDLEPGEHVYCCGPAPLMQSVQRASEGRPPETVHFEWFAAPAAPESAPPAGGFEVKIRSTGASFKVAPEQSLLDAMEANGACVPWSCKEGLCGTCQTGVLSGRIEHRDGVLSAAQRAANDVMLVCVSRGCAGEVLELDL